MQDAIGARKNPVFPLVLTNGSMYFTQGAGQIPNKRGICEGSNPAVNSMLY
jgi:hypothetical protein